MISAEALQRIRENIADFSKGPFCIDLIVNSSCNLNCVYCRGGNSFLPESKDTKQVEIKYINRLLKSAKKLFVKEIFITSLVGEPLAYKKILKLLKLIKSYGFTGALLTNGALLNKKFARLLHKIKWDAITISIDSTKENTLYSLRPAINGAKYFKGILEFLDYSKKNNPVLRINANIVVTKKNYKNILDFFKFAEQNNIKSVCMAELLRLSEHPIYYESLTLNKKELNEFKLLLKKDRSHIHSNKDDWLESKKLDLFNRHKFCYYHFHKLLVNSKGDILKCNGDATNLQNLNIKRASLEEIWFDHIKTMSRYFYKNPSCFDKCCTPIKSINLSAYKELKK